MHIFEEVLFFELCTKTKQKTNKQKTNKQKTKQQQQQNHHHQQQQQKNKQLIQLVSVGMGEADGGKRASEKEDFLENVHVLSCFVYCLGSSLRTLAVNSVSDFFLCLA